MLQLVLDPRPHLDQLVTMQHQLPQIALSRTRHPDGGKLIALQQLQQVLGITRVRLLLAGHQTSNARRIAHHQFLSQFFQQPLEPARAAGGFDPHPHRFPLQTAIKLLRLSRSMRQFLPRPLSRRQIQHGNLLKAGMEITAYNLHRGSFPARVLGLLPTQDYSAGWSRRCYPIKPDSNPY